MIPAKKIKILYLITDLAKGGAERSIIDLCTAMKYMNEVECVIGSLFNQNDFSEETSDLTIVNLEYKTHSVFSKSFTPKYHQLIEEFKPDVIHSNRYLAEFLTAEKIYEGIVYVCHGRDNMVQLQNLGISTLFNKGLLINYYEKLYLVYKKYLKTNTYFIANSSHTKKYFQRVLPSKSRKNVFIIHNAVNLDKYQPLNHKTYSYKKSGKLRLVNIGSFQKKKNQSFLVEIAKILNENSIDFEFHLIGGGDLKESVEKKVKENDLDGRFKFYGKVNAVQDVLKRCDLYVHVATYEPFGIVLLEAMASGLPVIALDGKGNRDIIINDKNGYLIDSPIPQIFYDKISDLIRNESLYAKVSNGAIDFVSNFGIKEKAEEYVRLYRKILDTNSPVDVSY